MLMVDLMHEFELSVWKSLFAHIICILYAAAPGGRLIALLDERYSCLSSMHRYSHIWLTTKYLNRYRQMPPFSQVIRRFMNNVSEMKKLAAQDFEDLLQVKYYHFLNIPANNILTVGLFPVFYPSI
jgi:hypothetical protein